MVRRLKSRQKSIKVVNTLPIKRHTHYTLQGNANKSVSAYLEMLLSSRCEPVGILFNGVAGHLPCLVRHIVGVSLHRFRHQSAERVTHPPSPPPRLRPGALSRPLRPPPPPRRASCSSSRPRRQRRTAVTERTAAAGGRPGHRTCGGQPGWTGVSRSKCPSESTASEGQNEGNVREDLDGGRENVMEICKYSKVSQKRIYTNTIFQFGYIWKQRMTILYIYAVWISHPDYQVQAKQRHAFKSVFTMYM